MIARDAHDLAVELRARGDAFVTLCSEITGIPFEPDSDQAMSLDEWFSAALDVLASWRTAR